MSGSATGCSCSKSRLVSPGSGIEVGAGIGRGIFPISLPAFSCLSLDFGERMKEVLPAGLEKCSS
jgi:hypothetical protein